MKIDKMLVEFANKQSYILSNDEQIEYDYIYFIDIDSATMVVNPFIDESGRFIVDPSKKYGKEIFNNWKEKVIARINEK